jgi:uncharacterized protein (TIGR02145 family)
MVYRYLSIILFLSFTASCFPHPANKPAFKNSSSTSFIENKGQIIDQHNNPNPSVLYLLNSPGLNVQLRKGGFSYDVYSVQKSNIKSQKSNDKLINQKTLFDDSSTSTFYYHRIDIDLINSNPNPTIIPEDPAPDYFNYFTASVPAEGIKNVRQYSKITYKEIYPGIDLEFFSNEVHGYKYNFVAHPGGNVSDIEMKISGADEIISAGDTLKLKTKIFDVNELIPESYFERGDSKSEIKIQFRMINTGVYGFTVDQEIPVNATLVIDPTSIRTWGTYYGGLYQETGGFCSVDHVGNVFLSGQTGSYNNIATTGSYQNTLAGMYDCYLVKFNAAGQRLWGTYFGGVLIEMSWSCITDNSDNIYVSGTTNSISGIASPGAHQTIYGGGSNDIFIEKFNQEGFRLWGTYYGGAGNDIYGTVTTDKYMNLFLTGETSSDTGISTPGSYMPNPGTTNDNAFLVKFDSNGVRQWGTYYGGDGATGGYGCATDKSGNIYFAGQTYSDIDIASPGAYQTVFGGMQDGFLSKFTTGGQRLWATYYGGTVWDYAWDCTTDSSENVCLIGVTESPNGIASPGCHQPVYGGGYDYFLAKFDSSGQRQWGTYYGGMGNDFNDPGLMIGFDGDIFIAGTTQSNNNISTLNSYQPVYSGSGDAFLAKFNAAGQRQWGTYYGGSASEGANSISYISDDTIYMAGATASLTNIASPGAFQDVLGGYSDGMLIKFLDCWPIDTAGPIIGPADICIPSNSVNYSIPTLQHAVTYSWTLPPGFTITAGAGTQSIFVDISPAASPGMIWVKGLNKCNDPGDSAYLYVNVHPRPVPVISGPNNICAGPGNVYSTAAGKTNYQWSTSPGGVITAGGTPTDYTVTITWNTSGLQHVYLNYTENGCDAQTLSVYDVTVTQSPMVDVTISTPANNVCEGTQVTFTATPTNEGSSPTYQWKVNGIGVGTSSTTYTYTPASGDLVSCILTSSITGCILNNPDTSNVITMVVNPILPVSVSISTSVNPFCQGSTITFTAVPTNGGSSPSYQWKVNGGNVGAGGPVYSYVPNNGDIVSCVLNSSIACPTGNPATSNSITMVENTNVAVSVSVSPSANPVCAGTPVTFTATPTNGGTLPAYQWKVNGTIVGTNNPVYSYVPVNGDVVTCKLTSNATCASGNPATSNAVTMTVNPNLPVSISINASANPVCAGISVTYTATPNNPGNAPFYQWKVNGVNVGINLFTYTYSPAPGDQVSCILTSNAICPIGNPATSNTITMTVNPNLPVSITITASNNPVCSGLPVTYTATPTNGGFTPVYQWKVNGINAGTNSPIYTYNPASGDLVSCILTSSVACPIGNPATSNIITMNVASVPVVTFTRCNDSITTTNAQPFRLKGGIPLGGTYSGPGVTNGIFSPSIAGVGTKTITYSYTNAALCSASASKTILVIAPSGFVCGSGLTDIRDNKVYQTVQIGAQCWMAANLNYGTLVSGNISQRDNCVPEKYCLNDVSANCGDQTYYQWDELMQYGETVSTQGFCPPGWHVPTEADWNTLFANYISNGFAGSPLKYSGFSGFNAILSGARHLNKTWDYSGFAGFFWSSTIHGINKAWAHGMNEADPSVSAYPSFRSNAFSVRCLKD